MVKVELTSEEAKNVRVALIRMAKTPEIDENGMKILLMLSDKFVLSEKQDVIDEVPKKENKGNKK